LSGPGSPVSVGPGVGIGLGSTGFGGLGFGGGVGRTCSASAVASFSEPPHPIARTLAEVNIIAAAQGTNRVMSIDLGNRRAGRWTAVGGATARSMRRDLRVTQDRACAERSGCVSFRFSQLERIAGAVLAPALQHLEGTPTQNGERAMDPIEVTFPGGKRVDARVGSHVVHTDQPIEAGGEGSAVGPFELFLASVAACAGTYVLAFCEARRLPVEGTLRQRTEVDPTSKLPTAVLLELTLPASFPEKYRAAVVRAAEGCKVKRTITAAPPIVVQLAEREATLANAS
jgi:putative redox protein